MNAKELRHLIIAGWTRRDIRAELEIQLHMMVRYRPYQLREFHDRSALVVWLMNRFWTGRPDLLWEIERGACSYAAASVIIARIAEREVAKFWESEDEIDRLAGQDEGAAA